MREDRARPRLPTGGRLEKSLPHRTLRVRLVELNPASQPLRPFDDDHQRAADRGFMFSTSFPELAQELLDLCRTAGLLRPLRYFSACGRHINHRAASRAAVSRR